MRRTLWFNCFLSCLERSAKLFREKQGNLSPPFFALLKARCLFQ